MTILRNPSTTIEAISYYVHSHESGPARWIKQALSEPDNPHQYGLISVPSDLARGLMQRYARGDSMESLRQYFNEGYRPTLQQAAEISRKLFPDHVLRMHFEQIASWMLLFALVCFDEEGADIARLDDWFTPDCNPVLFAMIRKAFEQGDAYVRKPNPSNTAVPHEEQLVAALLQPPATWPQAFGAYMKQWPRLMQKYGYREHVEEERHGFDFVPFHLGLAVCAFDVDDSAFCHLPYYPRDLVDYYRVNIRHQRDAWRARPSDPALGLPDDARPQPKKTYVLSKAEAYGRWIELVCGEDPERVNGARKALGKRKTMSALDQAMESLASAGLAIHADLKDDETVAAQATSLCASWNVPAKAMPDLAQQGPARITAILNALHDLDTCRGQRLVMFDDGGDNWHGLMFSFAHEAEFNTLCEQLGLKRMDRGQWQC